MADELRIYPTSIHEGQIAGWALIDGSAFTFNSDVVMEDTETETVWTVRDAFEVPAPLDLVKCGDVLLTYENVNGELPKHWDTVQIVLPKR